MFVVFSVKGTFIVEETKDAFAGGKEFDANGGSVKTETPKYERRPSGPSPLVRQNTNFALRIYCAHVEKHPDENFVYSPMSVTLGLSLLYAGSAGDTATEMQKVMELTGEPTSRELHKMVASLGASCSGKGCTLSLANSLFLDTDQAVQDSYLSLLQQVYDTKPENMDFGEDVRARRAEINQWVENATAGKIKDLLPEGSVTVDTNMVLANALHFKAEWAKVFNKASTRSHRFYSGGSGNSTVDMMRLETELYHGHLREWGLQVLELPYSGDEFSMFIILPVEQDGLPSVESKLCGLDKVTGESLLTVLDGRMSNKTMEVNLPKFTVEGSLTLHQLLPSMGMVSLFSADRADLSGISGMRDLYVDSAFHKAFIEVNEEGTEAAAATANTVALRSLPPQFLVDRPFMFYVRDNRNKSVVMMGRLWDPKKAT